MATLRACSVLLLLGSLCACKSAPSSSPDVGVSAIQFDDMAVPQGISIRERDSHSAEEAGWRYGHFVYSGYTNVEEASAYILQRMPQHSWTVVADQQVDRTTRKLKFARGRYTAEYTLQRQDGLTHMSVDYRTEIPSR